MEKPKDEILVEGYEIGLGYDATPSDIERDEVTDQLLADLSMNLPTIRHWLDADSRNLDG